MKIIRRDLIDNLEEWLFKGKIIIIYGARQVGKTTLVNEIISGYTNSSLYLNCDLLSVRRSIEKPEPSELKLILGNAGLVVFDEAQQVENIGLVLKVIHDTFPEIQIIATGSSSFDLSNKINEPLTGRAIEFILYPFSLNETLQIFPAYQVRNQIETYLRYGLYPEIVNKSEAEAQILLENLSSKYLYKDVLEYEKVRKPQLVVKLLQMLALQTGSEVSVNELAVTLQVSRSTIEHYIDLLEKTFVIFRLFSFSRNLRKELSKKFKVYFYDPGIRNSLIMNFNPMEIRSDKGALWENFFICERLKFLQKENRKVNRYFWRSHSKQEIDYLEETGGKLITFECKFSPNQKAIIPREFKSTYPESEFNVVHPDNIRNFLI